MDPIGLQAPAEGSIESVVWFSKWPDVRQKVRGKRIPWTPAQCLINPIWSKHQCFIMQYLQFADTTGFLSFLYLCKLFLGTGPRTGPTWTFLRQWDEENTLATVSKIKLTLLHIMVTFVALRKMKESLWDACAIKSLKITVGVYKHTVFCLL